MLILNYTIHKACKHVICKRNSHPFQCHIWHSISNLWDDTPLPPPSASEYSNHYKVTLSAFGAVVRFSFDVRMLLTYCRLCCGFWAWKTDNFSNWDRFLDSKKHTFERWCDLLVDTASLKDDLLMMQSFNFFSSFFQYTLVGNLENISICSGDNIFFFFFLIWLHNQFHHE